MKPNDTRQGGSVSDAGSPQDAATAGAASVDALEDRFKPGLAQAPYYSAGRHWNDYAPAYRFGTESCLRHAGRRFEEVAQQLEQEWDSVRHASRLGWVEARGAVEDAWQCAMDKSASAVGTALDAVAPDGRDDS